MTNPEGSKFIVLYKETAAMLQERHGKTGADRSFQRWVNDILKGRMEKEAFLSAHFPDLSKVAVRDKCMYIKDAASDHDFDTFTVYFKGGDLYCQADASENCDHVKFAWSQDEIASMQPKKKPPSSA